jgi:hypothetical protein
LTITSAPIVIADPSLVLDDPDEMMQVTNLGKVDLHWSVGGPKSGRTYHIAANAKPVLVPFHVLCLFLGDPRSSSRRTVSYQPKGQQNRGVIPPRELELQRIACFYGVYEENIPKMHKMTVAEVVNPDGSPRIDLELRGIKANPKQVKALPEVKVLTMDGHELVFPSQQPDSRPYGYQAEERGDVTDVASELARLRAEQERIVQRMEGLGRMEDGDKIGEVPEDAPIA